MSNIVEVKNLSFSFDGKHHALKDVCFTVKKGKYVTLIGHNGSGKSTLVKLIMGLLIPNDGEIRVFDLPLNEENIMKLRQKMGIVFQNPDNQFVGSTVRDDIAFGLENRCVPQSEMDEIIKKFAEKVNMSEFLDKAPENLSGGQKQRVAIAGVIALSPELIIFDESTSMLDPRGRREIRNVIKNLREEHPDLTIVSITHDIEEAFNADYILLLHDGQLVLEGNPEEFFLNEKFLLDLNIDLPFFYKFKNELQRNGLDMSDCNSLKEIYEKLCQ